MVRNKISDPKLSQINILSKFEQCWLFEDFFESQNFEVKRLFGGVGIYYFGRMVSALMEDGDETTYRGIDYKVKIWNGLLIPTEKSYHQSLMCDLPGTIPHYVLGKWLYLPLQNEHYEETSIKFIKLIQKKDPRVGVLPKT